MTYMYKSHEKKNFELEIQFLASPQSQTVLADDPLNSNHRHSADANVFNRVIQAKLLDFVIGLCAFNVVSLWDS